MQKISLWGIFLTFAFLGILGCGSGGDNEEDPLGPQKAPANNLEGEYFLTISYGQTTCPSDLDQSIQGSLPFEFSFEVISVEGDEIVVAPTEGADDEDELTGRVDGNTIVFEEEESETFDDECTISESTRMELVVFEDDTITGTAITQLTISSCPSQNGSCEITLNISGVRTQGGGSTTAALSSNRGEKWSLLEIIRAY